VDPGNWQTAVKALYMAEIPDKLYFKIGEVCQLADVKPHVLRYWEAEFALIHPQRASSKQRLYRRVDVETILRIRDLLYKEGFTIAGAKKAMAVHKGAANHAVATPAVPAPPASGKQTEFFRGLKTELKALKKLLEGQG
jgi:DNA-binding transcriptional MerR regulator